MDKVIGEFCGMSLIDLWNRVLNLSLFVAIYLQYIYFY